jgi:Ca2+-binding RTX toxin-like protein
LRGLAGNDLLDGGRGADRLDGGSGNDTLAARDGTRDTVACGPGRDKATVDSLDRVSGCETVRR